MEQKGHQVRMAERQNHGIEHEQAVVSVQDMETYLNNDELAALLEVFEDHNSTKGYLGIKTPDLCKAWIQRKLIALGLTPSFM